MRIRAHCIGPTRQHVLERVRTIAHPAIDLVQNETGIPLHGVELFVTDTYFTRYLFGHPDDPSIYGCTVYGLDRIVAVINAQRCGRDLAEVDKTVIHELVHAAQMSKPGVRRREKYHTRESIDQLQGLALCRTRWDADEDEDEAEASDLECLALQLPAA